MAPYFFVHNKPNQSLGYRKHFCNGTLANVSRLVKFSYCKNVFIREFCLRILYPRFKWMNAFTYAAPLSVHIRDVIRHRAKKQVTGVNAGSHIALMKHAQSFFNWTIFKNPRKSMCSDLLSTSSGTEVSIARRSISSSSPKPAIGCFSYFVKKAVFCGHAAGLISYLGSLPTRKAG